MPLNRVQVQPMTLLIQYEAQKYLGYRLITLTPSNLVCLALWLVQVQPMSNLLIQYEAQKCLGFGLIALTPPNSVCLELWRSQKSVERDAFK